MAIKGLSIPVFGKYSCVDGEASYTDGFINPHAVSYSIAVEAAESNPLYGDNKIVENDAGKFASGTYTLETDDLTQETSKLLLGVKEVERTYGEGKKVTSQVYDDDQDPPFLGCGIIEEHQINDEDLYKAVILKKVQFNIPEDAATTRGNKIEWQTKTITGNIMRSDENGTTGKYPWKEDVWFESEGEALMFLKAMLGVAA